MNKNKKTIEIEVKINPHQTFRDLAFIGLGTFALTGFLTPYKQNFLDFFNKSGLLATGSLEESLGTLTAHTVGNAVTGFYSGVTDRYFIPGIFFASSFIPELFDTYNEDFGTKAKRIAFKAGVVYGGFALGKIGKKLYKLGKEIYELNTNQDGVDLFPHH